MPHKSSFIYLLSLLLLVACSPAVTQLPPTGEIIAPTAVVPPAETLPPIIAPTLLPTQPQPTVPLASPTVPASPTPESTPGPAYQIAYLKGGDVYLWKGSSPSIGLTDTHDAVDLRISDDGALIAYVRQDPNDALSQELWLVNTGDKPDPRVLIPHAELAALNPDPNSPDFGIGIQNFAWRPGSHELVYSTLVLHGGPGFSPNHDVRLVDADSLAKTTLLDKGEGGLFYLSPDGNQVALSNPINLNLINIDGTDFRQNVLTFPEVITYSEYQYHPHPIWAADSQSLRVTIPPADPLNDPLPPTSLYHIPVDGSPAVKLGEIYAMPFAWPDHAFAPDLQHIAYSMPVEDPSLNQRELHLANADASNDTAYDKGESLEFKLWSPDSEHFLYEVNGGSNEGVYIGASNAHPQLIQSDAQSIFDIQWLGESHLAYILAKGDQFELHIMDLSGEDVALIDTIMDGIPVFDALP